MKEYSVGVKLTGKDKSKPVKDGLDDVGKKAKKAKKDSDRLGKSLGRLSTAFQAVVAWRAARAGWDYLSSYTDAAGEIADFSRQVGLSAEALQEWRHASTLAGLGGALFDKAATKLNTRLGEMRQKTGSTYAFIKKVSPDLWRQFTGAKDTDEAMDIAVRSMERIKDPAKRALFAAKVFGNQLGPKMARFAELGSEGIAKAREEARKFGVISGDAMREAEDFGDDVDRLKLAFGGLKTAIGSELLPVLRPMVVEFAHWVRDNKGNIAKKIGEGIRDIGSWLKGIDWKGIGKGLSDFFGVAKDVWDAIGGIKGALLTIGGIKLAGLAASLGPVGAAIGAIALSLGAIVWAINEIEKRKEEEENRRAGIGLDLGKEAGRSEDPNLHRVGLLKTGIRTQRDALTDKFNRQDEPAWYEKAGAFLLGGPLGLAAVGPDAEDRATNEIKASLIATAAGLRQFQAGVKERMAPPTEVNLTVTVPPGTEVEMTAKGPGKVKTKERRTGRRRIGG